MGTYTIAQVKTAILNKWDWEDPLQNVPLILWGPPGIGKTEIVYNVVAQRKIHELKEKEKRGTLDPYNRELLEALENYEDPKEIENLLSNHLLVLRLAERPIEQIEGVPAPYFDKKCTVFLMPENLIQLKDSSWVVVFIDELDKASESKMAAATHLFESLIIGDFRLPRDTFIIGAANRVSDSWLSKPVSPELCNRMAHVELEADIDSWCIWGKELRNIQRNYQKLREQRIRQEILDFHQFKKMQKENFLGRYHNDNEAESPRGFATPRSWHKSSKQSSKVYRKYDVSGWGKNKEADREVRREVEQLVGDQVASEYYTYLELYTQVSIKKILSGEQKLPTSEQKTNGMSEQYVYAFVLAQQLREEDLNKASALQNVVQALKDMVPDLRVVFVQLMNHANQKVLYKITNSREASDIVDEIVRYIAD